MFDIKLLSIEQDGSYFTIRYHGNVGGDTIVATVNTPTAAAMILKALVDERI
jgi:hypothetical protein